MIRLLALDLDGTLIGDDLAFSPRVRSAVAAAQERRVVVTLATGRMLDVTVPFAEDLKISAPLICYQGALVQAPDADAPLYHATMEAALVREVLQWQARHGWHFVLYTGDAVFARRQQYPTIFHHILSREQVTWVDDLFAVLERDQPVKFIIIAEPPEADRIEAELHQRVGGRIGVVRSHPVIVEGNPPGVSKGDALRRLAAHLGIAQAQSMAIGDQANDAPMIAWAGMGVAMGSGSPVAKAVADWIAPPLEEDGAAVAIERFVLSIPHTVCST